MSLKPSCCFFCLLRSALDNAFRCFCRFDKNFSEFGCFQKSWYPQIIHFNRVFHYKPSILGYPYFWKHLFQAIFTSQEHHPKNAPPNLAKTPQRKRQPSGFAKCPCNHQFLKLLLMAEIRLTTLDVSNPVNSGIN